MDEQTSELGETLQEAMRLVEEERASEAFELLRSAEESHPTDPTLLCLLGVVAGETEDAVGLAYDYYRRALAEQPMDPPVLVAIGAGLARYDDPEAERVLRLAAVTAPELPAARLQYGAYLAREGLFEEAVKELEAARELDPEDPAVARELATAHVLGGGDERALLELERAVELGGEADAGLRFLYGLALVRAGRLEDAAEEIHRGAAEQPYDADVQILTALACASQEWWDQAWAAFALAEAAPASPDPELLREVEDLLEAGAEPAAVFLREQLAPPMLRERLMQGA